MTAWRSTALLLSAALLAPAAEAGKERMPAFAPELAPLAGTWKHERMTAGEDVRLWLVIKEDRGRLRLRYQLPVRDKVYTSDWDGRMELTMQVNIKERRERSYEVRRRPPGIAVKETVRYSGSDRPYELRIDGVYELDGPDRLLWRCLRLVQGGEERACPAPLEYRRVSNSTHWPE